MSKKHEKYFICILTLIFIVLNIFGCAVFEGISEYKIDKKSIEYQNKIIEVLDEVNDVSVGEIFEFDFAKAFVLSDDYMSGDLFANEYDLNISVSEVKESETDTCGRIVFVNENGDFVFTFTYKKEAMYFEKRGLVIYPETKIAKAGGEYGDPFVLSLDSQEYFYMSRDSKKYTNSLVKYYDSDKVLRAYNIFYFGYSIFSKAILDETENKIVFYDKDGVVMYEYYYDSSVVSFSTSKDLIYPDDIISKIEKTNSGIKVFEFSDFKE